MRRVGFVVNPIAGMGGRIGLKGTDGRAAEAVARGAVPVSPTRGREMLRALQPLKAASEIFWIKCKGPMGSDLLDAEGYPPPSYEIATVPPATTTADDTKRACREFEKRGAELILFCGGDGTCRDVIDAVDARVPILGIPAGVKMHSGVSWTRGSRGICESGTPRSLTSTRRRTGAGSGSSGCTGPRRPS